LFFTPTVPTGDWTVEEAFQWLLMKSNQEGENLFNDIIEDIEEHCTLGEQELLQAKRQVEAENQPSNSKNNSMVPHQKDNNPLDNKVAASATKEPMKKAAPLGTVYVDVDAGPYMGKKYTLKVTPRAPRLVGRSQSKNFREKGISLSKDLDPLSTGTMITCGQTVMKITLP
jgi:hypothetical protein